jgi:hypothetical protein
LGRESGPKTQRFSEAIKERPAGGFLETAKKMHRFGAFFVTHLLLQAFLELGPLDITPIKRRGYTEKRGRSSYLE